MRRRLSWGSGIAMVYAAFAASTIGMVVFAITHPVDLVRADYYAQSEQYDGRIAAVEHADALGTRVAIAVDSESRSLLIMLPAGQAHAARGTVELYRASSAGEDRHWPLALDAAGFQRLSLAGLTAGSWRVSLEWRVGEQAFYREQMVRIP